MKNNKLGLKVMAALLAVAIVGSFAITTKSNNLRAMEGDEGFVEEAPAEVVQEVFVEPEPEIIPEEPAEEVPVEEPAEQPAEEAPEEPTAEEPAEEAPEEETAEEEEDKFDVEGAFATIRFMDEDSARAYLASLSGEDRAELKAYIAGLNIGDDEKTKLLSWFEPKQEIQPEPAEEPEEEKQEEKPVIDTSKMSLKIWDDRRPSMDVGETVTLYSELHGFEGINFSYRWQCNKGNGWEDVPGGNGATYSFNASVDSLSWSWRLLIDF